jgi:hypothetical protein
MYTQTPIYETITTSDKEVAPAERRTPRGPDHEGMSFMAEHRILRQETKREIRRTVLREATQRFNNELMDDEERQLLLDRIKRLRRGILAGAPVPL